MENEGVRNGEETKAPPCVSERPSASCGGNTCVKVPENPKNVDALN